MIVVSIEATHLLRLLRMFQLSVHEAVLCTVTGLDAEATLGPQLSLGAEAMRGLQDGNQ